MKLFKYRPLNELLYKELYYQELYFASYSELNDPLDLSAKIEFSVEEESQIKYLIWVIFKTTLVVSLDDPKPGEALNNQKLLLFNKDEALYQSFMTNVYQRLVELKKSCNKIWLNDLILILKEASNEVNVGFEINYESFRNEIERLTKKFLENSHTTCFSETHNDFLMWSHYASKHSGICLEFNLEHNGQFPYLIKGPRTENIENYKKRMSKWNVEHNIIWDSIKQVTYQKEQPFINFFDFSPVFDNEGDCDLIGLSKSWTHGFARELMWVFSTKTDTWAYEKEWRAIEINFGEPKEPDERIRHYPIEALSSVYFGIRTPEPAKKRISNLYKKIGGKIQFFECVLTNERYLDHQIWEGFEK